jgi:hypothetical protein
MQRRNYLPLVAGLAVILVTVVINSAAMAQVSGAIFTTNCIDVSSSTGQCQSTFVNGNVYDFIEDVFLNGGPRPNAHCDAAGLPNGDYYFQVTDPSGSELLSTDPIGNRHVTVLGGVIVAHSGKHFTGFGKCTGSIAVQLFARDEDGNPLIKPTPNPGGEYKVWMTPVDWYDTTKGFHGFIPSKSKTDNFKVVPSNEIVCPGDPLCPS